MAACGGVWRRVAARGGVWPESEIETLTSRRPNASLLMLFHMRCRQRSSFVLKGGNDSKTLRVDGKRFKNEK